MYEIYTTPSIVLSAVPHGDNDVILTLLTKEFGLLRAVANGLRKEVSKLRFSLQPFSVSDVSLVKGKSIWRVTNAKHEYSLIGDKDDILDKIRITITRLVYGEESGDLYNILIDGINSNANDNESIERIIILRILHFLGYVEDKNLEEFFKDTDISEELIKKSQEKKKDIIKVINKGFKISGM